MAKKTEILDDGFFEENSILHEEITSTYKINTFLTLSASVFVLIFGYPLFKEIDWIRLSIFGLIVVAQLLFFFLNKTRYTLYKDRIEKRSYWTKSLTLYIKDIENVVLLDYDYPEEGDAENGSFGIEINIKFDAQKLSSWVSSNQYEFKTFKTHQMFLHLKQLVKEAA